MSGNSAAVLSAIYDAALSDEHWPRALAAMSQEISAVGAILVAVDQVGLIIYSSACWRKFIATWKIDEGKLYLVSLEGRYRLPQADPMFADWFSGVLRIDEGEELNPEVGDGRRERELHITVENGVVIKERRKHNRKGKRGP